MKRFLRSLFLLGLSIAFVSLIFVAGLGVLVTDDLPNLDALKNYQPPQSTIVLDRNNDVVGRFYDERRTVISLENIPQYVKLAFVAAEDGDFYEHRGIDYYGLLRAIALEVKYRVVGGRRVGGSTITQQTARTMLLSPKQTYIRKLREMVLAKRIEDALSKDQILHLYLNQIYFGNGAYGIEEAAQTYFRKPAQKLALFEAALLASVPKSPNRINPFGDIERLKERQRYVLDQMVKHNFINEKQAASAKDTAFFRQASSSAKKRFAPYFLNEVKSELLETLSDKEVRMGGGKVYSTLDIPLQKIAEESFTQGLRRLDKRFGYRGPLLRPSENENATIEKQLKIFKGQAFDGSLNHKVWDLRDINAANIVNNPLTLGKLIRLADDNTERNVVGRVMRVNDSRNYASVDLGSRVVPLPFKEASWARPYKIGRAEAFPKKMSSIVKEGDLILVKLNGQGKSMWASLEQEPEINGGLLVLDVESGGVLAMVGGYDFDKSSFNRVSQAKRQVGSGIKPLIYAKAIDQGLVNASSIITDAPKAYFDPGTEEYWRPRNHNHKFLGDITLRRCLRSSINTCTITLLEKMGLDPFLSFASELGLSTKEHPYPRNLTIALGSAENDAVTFASAIRTVANKGLYSPAFTISSVAFENGVEQKIFEPEPKSLLSPESTFIVSRILSEIISPLKKQQLLFNVNAELTGKTGTTNNARSAWFFGYSPNILALVFVGYDDNRSLGENEWGITTAFPIWADFMNKVPDNWQEHKFDVPENIEWRYVDRVNGRAYEIDGAEEVPESLVLEAFIKGTAPEVVDKENVVKKPSQFFDQSAFAP